MTPGLRSSTLEKCGFNLLDLGGDMGACREVGGVVGLSSSDEVML